MSPSLGFGPVSSPSRQEGGQRRQFGTQNAGGLRGYVLGQVVVLDGREALGEKGPSDAEGAQGCCIQRAGQGGVEEWPEVGEVPYGADLVSDGYANEQGILTFSLPLRPGYAY